MSSGVSPPPAPTTSTGTSGVRAGGARLRLEGVQKRWRARDVPLLASVDLELEPGAVAVVTGRNGVGKTTLLRIVAGLIHADAGEVRLDGLTSRANRREYQRRIGFLSAGSLGLYARLTVRQHVHFWGRLAVLSPAEIRARTVETATQFDLHDMLDRRADRLSMGQRQRLRLALAFLHGPTLLVLDEPSNSLDGSGLELLGEATASFAASGGSVLYSMPAGQEVDALPADRVCTLEDGRLLG